MSEKTAGASSKAVEKLKQKPLLDVKPVGDKAISAISIMGEQDALAGNVLRRLCNVGGEACAKTCQLHAKIAELAQARIDKTCADQNLLEIVSELGINRGNVLMVGVGKDNIGFADQVESKREEYPYTISPVTAIKELSGFDAFFAREGDKIGGSEIQALGRRLADCGDINLEFTDSQGRCVMGFMHLSKPNLQGGSQVKYEHRGQPAGVFKYWLGAALDHYDADISSVKVRVAAAIDGQNYTYHPDNDSKVDERFPGWRELGLISTTDGLVGEGQSTAGQELHMDFRGMIKWQLDQVEGLDDSQVEWEGVINPADSDSQHASNLRATRGKELPEGRDAYFTAWADKVQL
jgi:hypothetical protein